MFTPLIAALIAAGGSTLRVEAADAERRGTDQAVAALLAAAEMAAAENDQPPASDLHVSLTPGVWLARAGGDVKLGPSSAAHAISLRDEFGLRDLEPTFNFEIALRKGGQWQIDASGFDFSTSTRGTFGFDGAFGGLAFNSGDAFSASFDMTSIALDVSYWRWHPIQSTNGSTSDLQFGYGAGARWLRARQDVRLTGAPIAPAQGEGEWLVPELVCQMDFHHDFADSVPILDAFEVLASGSVGPAIGGDGGVVLTLRAGIRGWLSPNCSLDFGYRLVEASVKNADYQLTGGLQGLFLSATLRF